MRARQSTKDPSFWRRGVEVVPEFLSGDECESLLSAIADYRRTHELPVVYREEKGRSLNYIVMEGWRFHEALPDSEAIVDRVRNQLESICGEPLVLIDDARAACNVNITPPGGQYRWHYDRNLVTALVYLNAVEGGETDLYPNYRLTWPWRQPTKMQSLLDRLLLIKGVRKVAGRPTAVTPAQGTFVALRGNTTLHSVRPVGGDEVRINLVVAFDRPGSDSSRPTLNAYLYESPEQ
jgi:2-oxoglutarate-Fe(II)-dependent oxygenase superfamily protein